MLRERVGEAKRRQGARRSTSCPRKVVFVVPVTSSATASSRRSIRSIAVVGVRFVPLEHRELVRVLVRDALVAEVLADLVDALEAADDQALQVELGRDPEVEVPLEVVPPRHERLRERASRAAAAPVSRPRRSPPRPGGAGSPPRRGCGGGSRRRLVHQQVEVALAVAQLDVREAVEGVRQRRAVLCEQLELGHLERRLARLGRMARHADHVAEVDIDPGREQLDPAASVDEVEEGDLPISRRASTRPASRNCCDSSVAPGSTRPREPDRGDLVPVGKALRQHGPEAYAAWMSRILYLSEPRGVVTSTVSPFFLPMIALPTGDSFESFSSGLASAEPTMKYSSVRLASTSRSSRRRRRRSCRPCRSRSRAFVRRPRAGRSGARASPARSWRRRTPRSR